MSIWSMILQELNVAWAIFFTVFFFGLCVFVHELGHFLAARLCGLHVDAFSIGFKKVWEKKIGGVAYRIGCLPFGGYCELPQVDSSDAEPKSADGTVLRRAKPHERIITAFAGPFFNILFGLLLGCVIWIWGVPQDSPKMSRIEVLSVEQNSPEALAGLQAGDVIVKLNGKPFRATWMEFAKEMLFVIGDVELTVERAGKTFTIAYTPKVNPNAPASLKYENIAWPFFQPKIPLELTPLRGFAAEKGGLKPGDILDSCDGRVFADTLDFQLYVAYSNGRDLNLVVLREGKKVNLRIQPELMRNEDGTLLEPEYLCGFRFGLGAQRVEVKEFLPGVDAAKKAGILPGDRIARCNGKEICTVEDFVQAKELRTKNAPMTLTILRAGKSREITVTPQKFALRTLGLTVVSYDYPNPIQQFTDMVMMSYKSLRGMLVSAGNKMKITAQTSSIQGRHMSGPVGIIDTIFSLALRTSFLTVIHFVVMISFALAIFNLLPLPVLDGGHISFALIELIIRHPIPTGIIKGLSCAFITLLLLLMIYVSYFDVVRAAHRHHFVSGENR